MQRDRGTTDGRDRDVANSTNGSVSDVARKEKRICISRRSSKIIPQEKAHICSGTVFDMNHIDMST